MIEFLEGFNGSHILTLPQDIQPFFIYEGKELTTIGLTPKYHLTVHYGRKSGVADMHLTRQANTNVEKQYITLLEIPRGLVEPLINQLDKQIAEVFEKKMFSDRINLGKLGRHNCFLISGKADIFPEDIIYFKKKKIKLLKRIKLNIDDSVVLRPQSLRITKSNEPFFVYSVKNGRIKFNGHIFFWGLENSRKPYFVRPKSLVNLSKEILNKIMDISSQSGVVFFPCLIKILNEADVDLDRLFTEFGQTSSKGKLNSEKTYKP
ncbi:MAG: hypothetical protein Q8J69_04100 [Sphingobacteriaceae bacterium]|nr:hypothetical protein [Sphingobacteriaceae bacterium]